jgi:hypothetical protein
VSRCVPGWGSSGCLWSFDRSHSSRDSRQTVAVKAWLIQHEVVPTLAGRALVADHELRHVN